MKRTLNVQNMTDIQRYIVGEYDVEILTLPRIYYDQIQIEQSANKYINIPGSGLMKYTAYKVIVGQVFVKTESGEFVWVCDLPENISKGQFFLQPGKYKVVYRQKTAVSTDYTQTKEFMVLSGEMVSITL